MEEEELEDIPVDITKFIFFDTKNREAIQFVNMPNKDTTCEQIQEDIEVNDK